jgi:RNA polymerase sigma-70 factor (ECF subfamily)
MGAHRDERFEELYRMHAAQVLAYCARRIGIAEAQDAAADVFVVVLRRIDDVPGGDRTLPWIYTVAGNVLRNRGRAHRRWLRLGAKLASTAERSTPGPEPQVVQNAEYERLAEALAQLSAKDQEILRLVEWEGLTREQVAEMFFVSRAAIDQRVSRAYKRLARTLGPSYREPHAAPVPIEEGGEV